MGELIHLSQRRADRLRQARAQRPAFVFDLVCPLSYLIAEQIERSLGDVEWVPAPHVALHPPPQGRAARALRERAEAYAADLRLPLVWPEGYPAPAPRALRAAAHACEIGAGARFALAASRLAFCGGFDLEDPETLAEAAAAAGMALEDCLAAAGDAGRDPALQATADGLRGLGITGLPAIRVGTSWFSGPAGLPAACTMVQAGVASRGPLAPVG